MSQTYSATLRNGQLEWGSQGAPPLPADQSVPVEVTVVSTAPRLSDGVAMAAALAAIADRNGAEVFGDPVEWQIELREDRVLPGRAE